MSHELAKRTFILYFQHSKIKFVSPLGHVISSIYFPLFIDLFNSPFFYDLKCDYYNRGLLDKVDQSDNRKKNQYIPRKLV